MKKLKTFVLLAFVFSSTSGFSQLKKRIHQTIDLTRTVSVKLALKGDYELVHWPGDHFLIETNIALYDANKFLLKHLIEHGRYEVVPEVQGVTASLDWKDKQRRKIMYKHKECFEETKVKIHIPDFFEIVNPTTLVNNKLREEFPDEVIKASQVEPEVELENEEIVEQEEVIEN